MQILIADDHKVVRMGLSLIVTSEVPGSTITEAGNAVEVLKVLRSKKIEMMLMDLKMPDTDSIGLLEQALVIHPGLRVLIVSLNPERVFAMRCLKAGAYGYVEKSADESFLEKAVSQVAKGKKYMSEDIVEQMAGYLTSGKSSDPFAGLTKKEFLITTHMLNGMGNKDICDALNLQSSTVATYKMRIFEKMFVKNMHELSQLAAQHNIF
jgi:two-component system invasion response regulator UvrY